MISPEMLIDLTKQGMTKDLAEEEIGEKLDKLDRALDYAICLAAELRMAELAGVLFILNARKTSGDIKLIHAIIHTQYILPSIQNGMEKMIKENPKEAKKAMKDIIKFVSDAVKNL